jgi:hypothetical protein
MEVRFLSDQKNEKIRKNEAEAAQKDVRMHFEGGVGGGGWARRGFWSLRIRRFAEYGVWFDTPCLTSRGGRRI